MKTARNQKGSSRANRWLSAVALAMLGGQVYGQVAMAPKAVMRDVATHEDIVAAGRKAAEENKTPAFIPIQRKDPSVANKPGDLISRSDILCFGGIATLVPKRAVIHIPKGVASRIGMQDGVKIVTWPDFLAANRAWITTLNVSRLQAEGNEPLSEATLKSFVKESRLVVATYEGGTISVLPLKVPETPTVATP